MGYGSSYYMMQNIGIGLVIMAFLSIAAFVVSIVVYRKFAGAQADVSREPWSWARFFKFENIMVSGILKYLYILSAFEIIAVGLGSWVLTTITGGVTGFFTGLLVAVIFIALNELFCRVAFEFMMLSVKLTENSGIIKNVLLGKNPAMSSAPGAGRYGASPVAGAPTASSPAAGAVVGAGFVGHASTSTSGVVTNAPAAAAQGTWVCTQCKRQGNTGAFCGSCGAPRP